MPVTLKSSVALSFIVLVALMFGGCSKFFTIGENKGYCEENGCDYSDAGLCADPYDLYQKRSQIRDEPYANIKCKCRQSNKTTTREN